MLLGHASAVIRASPGTLPPRKGIACAAVVTEARGHASAAVEAMSGSLLAPSGERMENTSDRRMPWLWRCRQPVQFPVRRHFRGRRTLSISEGESKPLPSGQDHRRGVAMLLRRCRLRGRACRFPC
ncbi:MAG: hypothetical protein Q6353_002250, partial [Candidatus Sigynarchaeum springense]